MCCFVKYRKGNYWKIWRNSLWASPFWWKWVLEMKDTTMKAFGPNPYQIWKRCCHVFLAQSVGFNKQEAFQAQLLKYMRQPNKCGRMSVLLKPWVKIAWRLLAEISSFFNMLKSYWKLQTIRSENPPVKWERFYLKIVIKINQWHFGWILLYL